jgi:hypothetical protein
MIKQDLINNLSLWNNDSDNNNNSNNYQQIHKTRNPLVYQFHYQIKDFIYT